MPMEFIRETWRYAKQFLPEGDSNFGPFTWNLHEGNLNINPQSGSSSADQMGIIMNGENDILLRSDGANIDIPTASLIMGGNNINGLATTSVVSSINPFKVFTPTINKYFLISIYIVEIIKCLTEENNRTYGRKMKYENEVFDYDYYDPVEGVYSPPELEE